jgi:hypothetical protein
VRTLSKTSHNHALCCKLNHGNTLVQLLHCLSLSSCQPKPTLPSAAQLLLSQSQQGDLVGHYLRRLKALERISQPNCEPLYATNTSHRKLESFLNEYPSPQVRLPTRTHNSTLLFGRILFKHGRHFDYSNHALNMRMRFCYVDCHQAGLGCYLLIHNRKAVTSITAVLFAFEIYLLTN